MDDDDYRRGKPACHKAFGEANAILAGDALLTLAFGVIAKRLNPKIAAIATLELADAIGTSGLVGGQAADLEFKGRITSLKSLNYINNLKTARLFEASARIGAIIAENGGERYIDAMAAFGAYLGRAFQIIDDVLDREGYAKASGVKKAREDAGRLIFGAKKALDIFGLKAGRLKDIADYILSRQT
jgi:geranylgeranyl diphosphate synthase type II